MVKKYIPKQGDIVFLNFNPTKGHEQNGKRPAIIVSGYIFNKNTNMALVCPITSNEKEYPTHYILKESKIIHGSVLCEHIKSIDYNAREIKYVESASDFDLINILMLLNACVENENLVTIN